MKHHRDGQGSSSNASLKMNIIHGCYQVAQWIILHSLTVMWFFFLPLKSHTDGFAASWREHTLWCMSTCHSHTDKRSCNSAGNFHFIPDVRGPAASLRLTCDSSTLTFLMRNHRRVVAPVYSKHQMLFLTFCSSCTGAVTDFPQF